MYSMAIKGVEDQYNRIGMLGSLLCLTVFLLACGRFEFVAPKQSYEIYRHYPYSDIAYSSLEKHKKDPEHLGTVRFSDGDPMAEGRNIELRKERSLGPSRYKALTPITQNGRTSTDFSLSFDHKRDLWLGLEVRIPLGNKKK